MMNTPLTLTALLERAGRFFPHVEVVSRVSAAGLHRCTWGSVYQRARQLAECLHTAGLQRGDRVATLMWNHYAHLEAYMGVPAAGGVLHALNLRLHPDEIAYTANHAQDRFLICDEVLLPTLEKFKDKVKFERIFVVRHPVVQHADSPANEADNAKNATLSAATAGGFENYAFEDYYSWLGTATGNYQFPELSEQDAATICFTSGTTGNPKGVLYSHRSLVLHTMGEAMADTCAVSQYDSLLLVSPLFHVNGWGLSFTAAMVGAKIVFPGPFLDAASLLDLIVSEQVTFSCAVPTVWLAVLAEIEKRGGDWHPPKSVRILCGGTAPPESLLRGLDRHGLHINHAWGMTETSPLGTTGHLKPAMLAWPLEQQYAQRKKQGWPTPFVDIRIVNDHGIAPWDGQTVGELEVRGPWVAASYYNAPDTKDRWSADGWFRTGDVAAIDPDGCVRLVDRSKDLVKSGGEWISSVDLENNLMSHPAVREAAVIAVRHEKWQERPLAVVVLKPDAKATADDLRAFLEAKFAKWQIPDDFVFVTELPHTSTGKLLKADLRKRYSEWKWHA